MCPLHGGDIIEKVDVLEWKVHFYAKTAQGPFIIPERSDISVRRQSEIMYSEPTNICPHCDETLGRVLRSDNF